MVTNSRISKTKRNSNRGISSEPMKSKDVPKLSPERIHIARIFKAHIDRAVEELGVSYDVTLQGRYDKTPMP